MLRGTPALTIFVAPVSTFLELNQKEERMLHIILLILFLFLILIIIAKIIQRSQRPSTHPITILIVDKEKHTPMAKVKVAIKKEENVVSTGRSNAEGKVEFKVEEGVYDVEFEGPDYPQYGAAMTVEASGKGRFLAELAK